MDVKKIGYGDLLQADIIVTTSTHATSKAIRLGTGGSVSHALIYAGGNRIVEAIPGGVREVHLDKALESDTVLAIALRHFRLTTGQRQQVIDNARKFLNLPYDKIGAAGAGVNSSNGFKIAVAGCIFSPTACAAGGTVIENNARPSNADKAFFCSELVSRAFELAGVKLVNAKPSFTHPSMLLNAPELRYVGHLRGA